MASDQANVYLHHMMSEEEISASAVRLDVAREAFTQADTMLVDVLENRKSIEQRAAILLAGYLPFAASIHASGVATIGAKIALGLAVTGICLLMLSFVSQRYPARGTSPKAWIVPGIIDGRDDALAHTLAHLTRQYDQRIQRGNHANRVKLRFVNGAIVCGAAAIATLAVSRMNLIEETASALALGFRLCAGCFGAVGR